MLNAFGSISMRAKYFAFRVSKRSLSTTVYVRGLPNFFNSEKFGNYAKSMGVVGHTARAILSSDDLVRCRGFGYLDFSSNHEAEAAVKLLNGSKLLGKTVKADIDGGVATPQSNIVSGVNTIFIKNLGFSPDRASVQSWIEQTIGEIPMKVRLAKGEDKTYKNYGHVDFNCKEDVDRALQMLRYAKFEGRWVVVERADPKPKYGRLSATGENGMTKTSETAPDTRSSSDVDTSKPLRSGTISKSKSKYDDF